MRRRDERGGKDHVRRERDDKWQEDDGDSSDCDWDFPTIELATHIQSELHLGFSHFVNCLHFPSTTAAHHPFSPPVVLLPLSRPSVCPPRIVAALDSRLPTPGPLST